MIELKNVTKSYGGRIIFNELSFTVDTGEFVIFSGKSGCGKSTMLSLIGGIEKPTSGHIIVDGADITERYDRIKYFSTKVAFLFQNFALSENNTVRQNLEMIPKKSRSEVGIIDALKAVGLEDKCGDYVYTLSGGEQQRVALARIMIKKCDIILADEPTGSLDKENSDAVIEILKHLNKEGGKTVIMVTHDEGLKMAGDRIINM